MHEDIKQSRGCIGTVVLTGHIESRFAAALADMRSHNDRTGFHAVEYRYQHGVLVESSRDALVQHALDQDYEWLLQIDADAAPFPPNALEHMLIRMRDNPTLDVLGGYCQLKAYPYMPTIDTGSGKWEEHYPNSGVMTVMRTGAHFLMTRMNVFKRFGPPWFRTRIVPPPLTSIRDVDNFTRQIFNGDNPFWNDDWTSMIHEARARSLNFDHSSVGEDSGFCDSVRATGGVIAVDTDLVIGHVAEKTIMPQDFRDYTDDVYATQRAALGVGWS